MGSLEIFKFLDEKYESSIASPIALKMNARHASNQELLGWRPRYMTLEPVKATWQFVMAKISEPLSFRRDKIGVPRRRYSKRLGSIGEKEMDVDDMNKEER